MRTFTIYLSSKQNLVIDETDFKKFEQVAPSGALVKLKGGIVNPSFVVCILPRKEKDEPQKEIQGYLDEERGVFVKTGEITLDSPIKDEFGTKEIAETKRIKSENYPELDNF
jgi:hypothetical protein